MVNLWITWLNAKMDNTMEKTSPMLEASKVTFFMAGGRKKDLLTLLREIMLMDTKHKVC